MPTVLKWFFFSPLAPENPPMKQTVPRNCSLTLHELAVSVCPCVQRIWCLPSPCQPPRSDVSITTPFSLLQMYFSELPTMSKWNRETEPNWARHFQWLKYHTFNFLSGYTLKVYPRTINILLILKGQTKADIIFILCPKACAQMTEQARSVLCQPFSSAAE